MSTAACFGVVLRSSDRGKALQTSKIIYRKLGIHKAYQLKICIALLRQEREAQN